MRTSAKNSSTSNIHTFSESSFNSLQVCLLKCVNTTPIWGVVIVAISGVCMCVMVEDEKKLTQRLWSLRHRCLTSKANSLANSCPIFTIDTDIESLVNYLKISYQWLVAQIIVDGARMLPSKISTKFHLFASHVWKMPDFEGSYGYEYFSDKFRSLCDGKIVIWRGDGDFVCPDMSFFYEDMIVVPSHFFLQFLPNNV